MIRPVALLLLAGVVAGCGPSFAVDGARAHARVVHQVEAGPRVPGTPGHRAIAAWIASELERLGGRVERQSWTDTTLGRPLELVNLIGRFGPEQGRPIVLCAHWDTRPFADRESDSAAAAQPVPGANDGGSGVAVLFEVAELMHRKPPAQPVELVFFDGEDQGRASFESEYFLGSRYYAARLAERPPDRRPVAAFLFDMVGDRDLQIHPEMQAAARAANLVGIVMEAARATGASHFHATPRHAVSDDHIPLLNVGLPAVDIIDFDYPAWHTLADLPDQVSAESLAEVSEVAAWLIYKSVLARR